MKINYEQFPVLEKLDKGIFGVIGINPSHVDTLPKTAMDWLRDSFKINIPYFKASIKYISKSLIEAINLAAPKLTTPEVLMKLTSCWGTLLLGNGRQFCYRIIAEDGVDEWSCVCYELLGNDLMSVYLEDQGKVYVYTYDGFGGKANTERARIGSVGNLILVLNFLKYAEVQTKVLSSNRQIWEGVNCLYNNKSRYDIEIIDSTWFTTLVKSDAFKVRGHFRLQPYGEGMSKRKLIWINEFQKEGYTRIAKKESQSI